MRATNPETRTKTMAADPHDLRVRLEQLERAVFPWRFCEHEWHTVMGSPDPKPGEAFVPAVLVYREVCEKCGIRKDDPRLAAPSLEATHTPSREVDDRCHADYETVGGQRWQCMWVNGHHGPHRYAQAAATHTPSQQGDLAERLEAAWAWLCGEHEDEDGRWFGFVEEVEGARMKRRVPYWWRSKYRELFAEAVAALRAPVGQQEEPVAWGVVGSDGVIRAGGSRPYAEHLIRFHHKDGELLPLYRHPSPVSPEPEVTQMDDPYKQGQAALRSEARRKAIAGTPGSVTDLEQSAWILIANAMDAMADWDEWAGAAKRWRGEYHAKLGVSEVQPTSSKGEGE